ncbi:hypothetical protein THAOC_17356, partial [Thalassiosira oceanica]
TASSCPGAEERRVHRSTRPPETREDEGLVRKTRGAGDGPVRDDGVRGLLPPGVEAAGSRGRVRRRADPRRADRTSPPLTALDAAGEGTRSLVCRRRGFLGPGGGVIVCRRWSPRKRAAVVPCESSSWTRKTSSSFGFGSRLVVSSSRRGGFRSRLNVGRNLLLRHTLSPRAAGRQGSELVDSRRPVGLDESFPGSCFSDDSDDHVEFGSSVFGPPTLRSRGKDKHKKINRSTNQEHQLDQACDQSSLWKTSTHPCTPGSDGQRRVTSPHPRISRHQTGPSISHPTMPPWGVPIKNWAVGAGARRSRQATGAEAETAQFLHTCGAVTLAGRAGLEIEGGRAAGPMMANLSRKYVDWGILFDQDQGSIN